MTTLITKLTVFGAKTEATIGTKESLTAAECAYNVYDFMVESDSTVEERQSQGSFGTRNSPVTYGKAKATFKMDFDFNGIVIPAAIETLFPACGLVKTGNTFKPISRTADTPGVGVKTLTIGKWWGPGKFIGLYGASGKFKLNFPTSKAAFFEFEFEGILDPESDANMPSPITYPTPTPLMCKGGPVTFAGVDLCADTMALDVGNELYVKECPGRALGYSYAIIKERKLRFTAPPESVLVGDQDRMGRFLNGTEGVLRYVLPAAGYNPGTGAKSVEIRSNQAQYMEYKGGDRNGVSTDESGWMLNNASGTADSDLTITFNL